MPKKDKRYNTPLDNYINKYKGTFKLGLVYVVLLGIRSITVRHHVEGLF